MNDQEKARARRYARAALSDILSENLSTGSRLTAPERALDAVLAADPRVIAEAMGGYVSEWPKHDLGCPANLPVVLGIVPPCECDGPRTVIVLPPRKVESP